MIWVITNISATTSEINVEILLVIHTPPRKIVLQDAEISTDIQEKLNYPLYTFKRYHVFIIK